MTDHRSRLLGQARADLVALPGLVDELSRCLTERPAVSGGGGGKPGSKAPLRLEVLHLNDTRRKPGWEGDDPRLTKYELSWNEGLAPDGSRLDYSHVFNTENAARNAYDRLPLIQQERATVQAWANIDTYGVGPTLEQWTRVLCEEMDDRPELAEHATVRSEAALLVEHWDWICEQQWADELAEDVRSATAQVRSALGERKDYREFRPTCRSCGWKLTPMDESKWFACSACGRDYTLDADLKALGQVQDGTIAEISELLALAVPTLHRWHKAKIITSVGNTPRGKLFNIEAVLKVAERVRESATG